MAPNQSSSESSLTASSQFDPRHYADRLAAAVSQKRTPLVVGLDPRIDQLPTALVKNLSNGEGHPDAAQGSGSFSLQLQAAAFEVYCKQILDVVADLVPAVKPQAAFFEALGFAGMQALANVVDYATVKNLIVIMDAKRGDIGTTAAAYAAAYLGPRPFSSWGSDALTVNPYMGDDTLQPFVGQAQSHGAGIYVLVKTSNPGSHWLQERISDGIPLYRHVAEKVQELAQQSIGVCGYGAVGAVVGATYPQQLFELRQAMPNVPLLIPGFGAQGGTAADVAAGFDEQGQGAIINSSRAIIFAYQNKAYDRFSDWQDAVSQATRDAIDQLATDTPAGRLRTNKL